MVVRLEEVARLVGQFLSVGTGHVDTPLGLVEASCSISAVGSVGTGRIDAVVGMVEASCSISSVGWVGIDHIDVPGRESSSP